MEITEFIEKTLSESGELVKASFGDIVPSQKKIEKSQIVTAVDVASERLIIERIIREYSRSGIIAEESGFIQSKNQSYFIVDPIDGTSNFANAIPWFGIMIAYIVDNQLECAGIYLPMTDEMYIAQKDKGATKNGSQIPKPKDVMLSDSLVSFCFSSEHENSSREAACITNLSPKVLNLRTTNSAYDYAYAAEGKLAATINFRNKIWDIASVTLIANEIGCFVSDTYGKPISFDITEEGYMANYTLLVSNPSVKDELLGVLS